MLALAALPSVVEGEPNDFQIVSLNGGAAAMFGKPDHLIRWKLLSELIPEAIAGDLYDHLGRAFRQQIPQQFELDLAGVTKEPKYFRVSVAPLGDLLGITLTDITGIRLREDSVKLLFESNPISLLLYDRETLAIVRVNDAMVERYGYSREALQAMTLPDLHPLAERARARECACTLRTEEESKRPWKHVTADGTVRDIQTYSRDISFTGRDCVLASIVEVTDQQRAQARVVFLAHHDHLTSLANRVLFRSELDQGLADCRGGQHGLFVHSIDLDHFKQVNDTLGHSAGDDVLREVAARIIGAVRPQDLVARLGGDEFAVVQFGVERREEAAAVATRIIERLSAPYTVGDRRIMLGASIGIAAAPGDAIETDALLKSADVALYRAKAEGRGTYRFFEAEMDEPVRARRHLETELRGALDAGQFTLHYQPILDAATETVVGCEALLRWFHPTLGAVPPARFIPLAEQLGIISALGEWVLQEACAEAARWPDTVNVAVNLSPAQFVDGGLAASVAGHLAASGLAPHRLELEITESVFLVESDANLGILRQLQNLGVTISLDDFGTGYSSLSYLRSFPVGKIKIDRSFVRDLADNPGCLAIVRAVTRLGESLGIATLAEGVETKDQFLRLRAEGCGQVQGFLFGGPVAASEIRQLLGSGAPGSRRAA